LITAIGQEHPSPDVSFGSVAALRDRPQPARNSHSNTCIKNGASQSANIKSNGGMNPDYGMDF